MSASLSTVPLLLFLSFLFLVNLSENLTPTAGKPGSDRKATPAEKGYTFNATENTWYKAYGAQVNWTDAAKTCQTDGGILITAKTPQRVKLIEYIRKTFLSNDWPWVGCSDLQTTGRWMWSDGTEISGWTDWYAGEPEIDEHCCYVVSRWGADECGFHMPFICEIQV